MTPDTDFLPFLAAPIPMWKEVQDRLGPPPALGVAEVVFREAARIENAEVRTDTRPAVGRRFTAIIESRPCEPAREVRALVINRPPMLGGMRPRWMVDVVRVHVSFCLVIFVYSARANSRGRFSADHRLLRELLPK